MKPTILRRISSLNPEHHAEEADHHDDHGNGNAADGYGNTRRSPLRRDDLSAAVDDSLKLSRRPMKTDMFTGCDRDKL